LNYLIELIDLIGISTTARCLIKFREFTPRVTQGQLLITKLESLLTTLSDRTMEKAGLVREPTDWFREDSVMMLKHFLTQLEKRACRMEPTVHDGEKRQIMREPTMHGESRAIVRDSTICPGASTDVPSKPTFHANESRHVMSNSTGWGCQDRGIASGPTFPDRQSRVFRSEHTSCTIEGPSTSLYRGTKPVGSLPCRNLSGDRWRIL